MGFRSSFPLSGLIRQFEQEMETVIKVLQPGPLGIVEHKFSADEIRKANATVSKAVSNWRRNAHENSEASATVLKAVSSARRNAILEDKNSI